MEEQERTPDEEIAAPANEQGDPHNPNADVTMDLPEQVQEGEEAPPEFEPNPHEAEDDDQLPDPDPPANMPEPVENEELREADPNDTAGYGPDDPQPQP